MPQGLTQGAPLVVVMHGSGQNGAQMGAATGYGFDRLGKMPIDGLLDEVRDQFTDEILSKV